MLTSLIYRTSGQSGWNKVASSCSSHGFLAEATWSRAVLTGPGAQLSSLAAWHQEQSLQGRQAVANKHKQQTDRNGHWLLTAGAAAAGVAAAGFGLQAHCESSSYAVEQITSSRWSKLLKRIDPRQLPRAREQNAFLEEMQADPKVAVVLALALPFLSLSFGYVPAKHELDVAAQLVQVNADELDGWEISSLLWAAARLGYRPADHVMDTLLQQVKHILAQPVSSRPALGAQEASMLVWALAVLHELTPSIWTALLDAIAAAPSESLDEVTLVHLYQAGMFADLDQIDAAPRIAASAAGDTSQGSASWTGIKVSAAEAPLKEEVQHKLQQLPPGIFDKCQQVYSETAQQAGFDGPYLIELTIMLLLSKVYPCLGSSPAYRRYFHDLRGSDLARARQLTEDPYMLIKFKSEIANRRAQQNNFVRQLGDISRTLKSMGLYHQVQGPVEDGLVHVDIALPDYKLALFLENAHKQQGKEASSSGHSDGTTLNGYVANETPGTKQAKLQLLEQLGWKCYSVTWSERGRSEEEKQKLLMQLITKAGQMHTMQGRMNSMVHGTLRTVGDEKSRFQNASVGYHLKRDKQ